FTTDLHSQKLPRRAPEDILPIFGSQSRGLADDLGRVVRSDVERVVAADDDVIAADLADQPGEGRRRVDHVIDVDAIEVLARWAFEVEAGVLQDAKPVLGASPQPGKAPATVRKV